MSRRHYDYEMAILNARALQNDGLSDAAIRRVLRKLVRDAIVAYEPSFKEIAKAEARRIAKELVP